MQNRMATHTMTGAQTEALLLRAEVGRMATLSQDGYPYVTPVHYVYDDGRIYVHGLPAGKKLDNIGENKRVGFEVDEMTGLITDGVEMPCDINTAYKSVIISGDARVITDIADKSRILRLIVEKYTPQLRGADMPAAMVAGTAVIEITINTCTGKYYK